MRNASVVQLRTSRPACHGKQRQQDLRHGWDANWPIQRLQPSFGCELSTQPKLDLIAIQVGQHWRSSPVASPCLTCANCRRLVPCRMFAPVTNNNYVILSQLHKIKGSLYRNFPSVLKSRISVNSTHYPRPIWGVYSVPGQWHSHDFVSGWAHGSGVWRIFEVIVIICNKFTTNYNNNFTNSSTPCCNYYVGLSGASSQFSLRSMSESTSWETFWNSV